MSTDKVYDKSLAIIQLKNTLENLMRGRLPYSNKAASDIVRLSAAKVYHTLFIQKTPEADWPDELLTDEELIKSAIGFKSE